MLDLQQLAFVGPLHPYQLVVTYVDFLHCEITGLSVLLADHGVTPLSCSLADIHSLTQSEN